VRWWRKAYAIDLVQGHSELASSGDLRQRSTILLEDSGSAILDVVLAAFNCFATSCSVGATTWQDRGIPLEWVTSGTRSWSRWINAESRALSALITNSFDDGTMAGNERSQRREKDNIGERETHFSSCWLSELADISRDIRSE
jgi:hypothetical protein